MTIKSSKSNIALIVAVSQNHVIGLNNQLPWYIPEELKFFKETTQDNIVIMGYNTFLSIRKPLVNRINIVLSTKDRAPVEGFIFLKSLDEAISFCETNYPNKTAFIIGGRSLYNAGYKHANTFYITKIYENFHGDTYLSLDTSGMKETILRINIIDNLKFIMFKYERT